MALGSKEIRDTIHGFVYRSDQEESLIDSKIFQRLRGIKQLAFANLVYPGALHTRFDHSIGVMHIGGRMADQLELSGEKKIIRLACLLHDIGHGPFSHVSEELLEKFSPISSDTEREEIHEKITCSIIKKSKELDLSDKEREKIIDLIQNNNQENITKGIITGPIDADKQDYLLRDSYYCGVKYGIFDLERLVESLTSIDVGIEKQIGIKETGIHAVEQFVISKYYMSTQVYRHKIRLVTDAMIVNALTLGITEDKLQFLKDIYSFKDDNQYIENYLLWDDNRIINEILFHVENGFCKKIFENLKERKLFKSIFHKNLKEFEPIHRGQLSELNKNKDLKESLKIEISKYLSKKLKQDILKEFILIVNYSIKSIRDDKSKDDIGKMLVKFDHISQYKEFEEQSTLLASIRKQENEQYIGIYAPLEWKSEKNKKALREDFNKEIKDLIVDYIKNNEGKYGHK
ncbi:MAG: HD domain-containing protein [Ignavibacterium album]|uniref:HD domain-containing protein n=1 Tax=Ignavibacterium album TaxID=591197 RepID=UPI0026F34C8C|nr:HD domain-containing protein [Ignavibacterium album]MCX8104665.1 HD domain-containing protein [Ignavibacterium album]